jgi:hypothetical protein
MPRQSDIRQRDKRVSGDYQHFIPQLLLKGFSTKAPDGSKCVWVFERETAPALEQIKRMGGDIHFYSAPAKDGSETLDDAITKYENRLGSLVRRLRKQKPGPIAEAEALAEAIAHLTIRTNSVRTVFSRAAKQMIAKAAGVFTDPKHFRSLLGLHGDIPSDHFRKMIAKWADENPAFRQTGLPLGALERVLFSLAKENFARFFEESRPQMHAALAGIYLRAESLASDGHKKALMAGVVPDSRVEVLRKMQWEIVKVGQTLILPDCIAIGLDTEGNATPLLLMDADTIAVVAMPISARRLVVGRTDTAAEFKAFLFNLHATACSETFFVSSANTAELAEWSKYIGVRSQTVINRGIEDAFTEHKHEGKNALVKAAPAVTETPSATTQDNDPVVVCSVHFCDCADEPTANKIASTVWGVVKELQQFMPLNRLDGVTFANDYPGALAKLDRGFVNQKPLTTNDEEGVDGVAMAPLVLRDGVVKSHLVLQGFLGHGLISEDESHYAVALHVLVAELVEAACAELFDMALPGVLLRPLANRFDAQRFAHVASAWSGYYSAYFAAVFAPDSGLFLRQVVVAALDRARKNVPGLRLDYRFHGDVQKLLDGSLKLVRAILQHSAKLIGHYDGLSQAPFDEEGTLEAALSKLGLKPWFEAYQSDLRKLWERRGQWESFDEFLSLGTHVERVMWQFGIVLWQTPEGDCRVEVPLATDVKRLPVATLKRPLWLAKAVARNLLLKIKRSA